MKIVIDATNGALGRIAAYAAKQALSGKEIVIVNCEKAIVTGTKDDILKKYKIARAKGGSAQMGPNFPKSSERIVKRTIRGMLPYKSERGRTALQRIICYNALPQEYENSNPITMVKKVKVKSLKLSRISEEL